MRIELGEVENLLVSQPGVSLAAVVVHHSGKGKRLIGYYSTESGLTISSQDLKHALSQSLPAYMVPTQFLHLDVFPLSANGKINRSALPAPEGVERHTLQSQSLPKTETEKVLWEWWSSSLERKNFGVNESFFDLGGDSMLLMTLFQYIKSNFGSSISSVDMFRFTSIRSLAAHIDGSESIKPLEVDRNRAARMQRALRAAPRGPRTRMR